jgi:hypothetical protein
VARLSVYIRRFLPVTLEMSGVGAVVWAVGALFGAPFAVLVFGVALIGVAVQLERET